MRNNRPDIAAQHVTSQSRRKSRPPPLGKSYRKVPMNNRINIATKPNDPDFIKMEQYFERQLRNDNQTIRQILEDHFTSLEIELFMPGERGLSTKTQKEDIRLYQALLAGPFKGKNPTLACKMAMLFFGLPVAPMKMEPAQVLSPFDFAAYNKKEQSTNNDPLAFLDEYSEIDPSIATGGKQDTGIFPNLRGGNLDDDEMKVALTDFEVDEKCLTVQSEKKTEDQHHITLLGGTLSYDVLPGLVNEISEESSTPLLHLFGRKGITGIGPSWTQFVEGVIFLLGLRKEQQSSDNMSIFIAIDLFEGSGLRYIQTFNGLLHLDPAKDDQQSDDEILDCITNNMNSENYKKGRRCFVRLARDRRPSSAFPADSGMSYIKVCRSDVPERPIVYMRTTTSPSKHNCHSQYSEEFRRTVSHLLPGDNQHQFLHLSLESGSIPVQSLGRIYVGQDLPQGLVDLIPQAIANGDSLRDLQINIQTEPFGCDNIPIFSSICRHNLQGSELGIAGVISKFDLTRMNSIADLIVDCCVRADDSRDMVQYVELYLPAQKFFDESIKPVLCYYEHGQAVATEDLWYERINRFREEDKNIFEQGFAIWGRPVFREYTLINDFDLKDTAECVVRGYTVNNLLDMDLTSFKLIISTFLFPQRYDVYDENNILFLSTGDQNEAEYVIRFDTTEFEWCRIKRRIASNKIKVKIPAEEEKYDLEKGTRWDIDPSSYWGLSHDNTAGNRLAIIDKKVPSQRFTETDLMTVKKAVVSSAKRFKCFTKDQTFGRNMREQVKWKAPSVFANPFKPVVPLNGPSIETFLRVGPRVPMVTVGMRTPTEVARLEAEVHKLRYLLLNRIRECPYSECGKIFEYHNQDALDMHLKEAHPILRCPYCVATGMQGNKTENELYFQNADQAMHHFNQYHWKHMMSQANIGVNSQGLVSSGIPSVVLSNEGRQEIAATYKHCIRCGRDHTTCHRREDRDNHEHKCHNMSGSERSLETSGILNKPGYCVYCGVESYGHCPNPNCVSKNATIIDPPEICCVDCGITWDCFDKSYQASHRAGCKPLGGEAWDFCGFCGISLVGTEHVSKLSHVEFCNERPRPLSVSCPICLVTGTQKELRSPEHVKSHLEIYHKLTTSCLWCDQRFPAHDPVWAECVKIQHFATHMGAVPQIPGIDPGAKVSEGHEKCPGFIDCGVIIGKMTSDQFRLHWVQSHDNEPKGQIPYCPNGQIMQRPEGKYNDVKNWRSMSPPQYAKQDRQAAQNPPAREDQYQWTFPKGAIQRSQSPRWKDVAKYSPGEGFRPSENMRCSRCFKPAPSRFDPNYEYEVNLHSDPRYSCRIRCAPGEYKSEDLVFPNRSGWVIFPEDFDFIAARRSFLKQYPAYQGTVFPFDDDRAVIVYNGEQPNPGVQSDDVLSDRAPWRHALPWPPIAGLGEYRDLREKNSRPIQVPAQRAARRLSTKQTTTINGNTVDHPAASQTIVSEVQVGSEPGIYSSNMAIAKDDTGDEVRGDDPTGDDYKSEPKQKTRINAPNNYKSQSPVQTSLFVSKAEIQNGPSEKAEPAEPSIMLLEKGKKRPFTDIESPDEPGLPTTLLKKRGRPQVKKEYTADIAYEELKPPIRFRRARLGHKDTDPAYGVGKDNSSQKSSLPNRLKRAVPSSRSDSPAYGMEGDEGTNLTTDAAPLPGVIVSQSSNITTRKSSRLTRSANRMTYRDDGGADEIAAAGTADRSAALESTNTPRQEESLEGFNGEEVTQVKRARRNCCEDTKDYCCSKLC